MPAKSKKQRRMMAVEECAYLAGLFDGEGYLTIRRSNANKRTNPCYRVVIGITNRDIAILRKIQSCYGGYIYSKSRISNKHNLAFEWTVHTKSQCFAFIDDVLPYIQIKREQLILGLEFLNVPKVRKIGKWPRFVALPEDIALREDYKMKLSILNKRGI